jgi:hypothetical protein
MSSLLNSNVFTIAIVPPVIIGLMGLGILHVTRQNRWLRKQALDPAGVFRAPRGGEDLLLLHGRTLNRDSSDLIREISNRIESL